MCPPPSKFDNCIIQQFHWGQSKKTDLEDLDVDIMKEAFVTITGKQLES